MGGEGRQTSRCPEGAGPRAATLVERDARDVDAGDLGLERSPWTEERNLVAELCESSREGNSDALIATDLHAGCHQDDLHERVPRRRSYSP